MEFRASSPKIHALPHALTRLLRADVPFTFLKRGDGEEACMSGEVGENCDGHPYSEELSDALRAAYAFLEMLPEVIEVRFMEADYEAILHYPHVDLAAVKEFWRAVRESPHRKILVAPARLAGIRRLLQISEHVEIPVRNAFQAYAGIGRRLRGLCSASDIFVFCAGMPGKVWMADLLKVRRDIWCIDAGSAFDALFFTQTREGQIGTADLQALYGDMM